MVGYLLVFCAALLWALIGLFSRGILDSGVSSLEIAFWRALLAGVLFVLHTSIKKRWRLPTQRDIGLLLSFAGIGVVIFYTSLNLAIATGGISLAFILLYSAPAFVALGAWLLLGEAMSRRKVALTALTLLGIVLVSQSSSEGMVISARSLAWGLLAGLSYASYYIYGKWLLQRYSTVTIYAYILPLGALGLSFMVDFSPKTPQVWGLFALLAFFSTYLAYFVYYLGLQQVEASRAVLVATIEPVAAASLAALVYGERFDALGMLGSALVLAAALLAAWPASWRRKNPKTSSAELSTPPPRA